MTTMSADYSNLPESALIALAQLILKRARLSLPCSNREQAVRVIRGVRPAPSRKLPCAIVAKRIVARVQLCCACHKPIPVGTPCDPTGNMHIGCCHE